MSLLEREKWSNEVEKISSVIKKNTSDGITPSKYCQQLNKSTLELVVSTIELIKSMGKEASEEIITKTLDTFRNLLNIVNTYANNSTYSVIASAFHLFNYLHNFSEMDNFLSSTQKFTEEDTTYGMYCMYNYYAGMTMLIKNQPSGAMKYLTNSIELLPLNSPNYRKVLVPLIVLHLRKGEYPPSHLIVSNNLTNEFNDLILSLQRGDIVLYENEVRRHEAFFIHHGLFLLVESLKLIVYRNLFEFVQKIDGSSKIAYVKFQNALSVFGKSCSDTELEFIFCNMAYKGIMKCQVYHCFSTIVLSPSNPFSFFDDK